MTDFREKNQFKNLNLMKIQVLEKKPQRAIDLLTGSCLQKQTVSWKMGVDGCRVIDGTEDSQMRLS